MKPLVNVCIPVYYSGPDTIRVLDDLLATIRMQDYPQARIRPAVSVQECDMEVFPDIVQLLIKYRCASIFPKGDVNGPASNTNSAMSIVEEGYIKLMNQDDMLDRKEAISEMVDLLEGSESRWLASACIHTDGAGAKRERPHMPSWPGEKKMVEAVNRLGCPSVIMFDSALRVEFDTHPDICYAMDCEFYIQMYRRAGLPLIHSKLDVVVRMWSEQLTHQVNIPVEIEKGKRYMRRKYDYS